MTDKKRSPRTENPVRITDPKAIRALAHGARLAAINELYSSQKSWTATELAAFTGLTPSAMSYHLRALKKWGIVVDAPNDGDGRERRWKAAGTDLNLDTATTGQTPGLAIVDMELDSLRKRIASHAKHRDAARRRGEPDESPVMMVSGNVLKLTLDQRAEFKRRMSDLLDEFDQASAEAAESAEGAEGAAPETERMYVLWSMLPEVREVAHEGRKPASRPAPAKTAAAARSYPASTNGTTSAAPEHADDGDEGALESTA
ncbi:MarR family transcriptional regulator [Sinomonas sp. JGH33]|uniref:MarR family transcriptional regulator n=1 Tax=Sinomonas terricola TaxID=3110330 RepID=A0ABU5T2C1_9MICC|nr:MarR family transcriptional regulator [Sinomonas sp. JGH33]MEA5453788.1 MarR family transcriptional regulator [Sinomonas sp. JGH33]